MNKDFYKASRYRFPFGEDGRDGASGEEVGDRDEHFEELLLRAMRIDAPELRQHTGPLPGRKISPKWVWSFVYLLLV